MFNCKLNMWQNNNIRSSAIESTQQCLFQVLPTGLAAQFKFCTWCGNRTMRSRVGGPGSVYTLLLTSLHITDPTFSSSELPQRLLKEWDPGVWTLWKHLWTPTEAASLYTLLTSLCSPWACHVTHTSQTSLN